MGPLVYRANSFYVDIYINIIIHWLFACEGGEKQPHSNWKINFINRLETENQFGIFDKTNTNFMRRIFLYFVEYNIPIISIELRVREECCISAFEISI